MDTHGRDRPPHSSQRLVEAARELLTERPAASLTVREIAARAGVQHTLIGRHFGSRDGLVAVVVLDTLSQFAAQVAEARDLTTAVRVGLDQFASNRALASGMAVFVLGRNVGGAQRYPLADAYEAQLVRAGAPPDLARKTAVVVIATMAGWAVGEHFWVAMAGRQNDPGAGREIIERAVWTLVDDAFNEVRTTKGHSR